MNTFPLVNVVPKLGQHLELFSDAKCRNRAAVFDLNGSPLPGNAVTVDGGVIPQFQANATLLYARDTAGQVEMIYAHLTANPPVVSGSKGGNAALASLIAGLAGSGLVVDQTS